VVRNHLVDFASIILTIITILSYQFQVMQPFTI